MKEKRTGELKKVLLDKGRLLMAEKAGKVAGEAINKLIDFRLKEAKEEQK